MLTLLLLFPIYSFALYFCSTRRLGLVIFFCEPLAECFSKLSSLNPLLDLGCSLLILFFVGIICLGWGRVCTSSLMMGMGRLTSDAGCFFDLSSSLIYLRAIVDFFLEEQFEKRSSASFYSSCAQFIIFAYFLCLNSLKVSTATLSA